MDDLRFDVAVGKDWMGWTREHLLLWIGSIAFWWLHLRYRYINLWRIAFVACLQVISTPTPLKGNEMANTWIKLVLYGLPRTGTTKTDAMRQPGKEWPTRHARHWCERVLARPPSVRLNGGQLHMCSVALRCTCCVGACGCRLSSSGGRVGSWWLETHSLNSVYVLFLFCFFPKASI